MINHVNATNDEDFAVLLDLSSPFGRKPAFTGRNSARLQRATKGARQSTGRRRHHVIQGGGVRFVHVQVHAIMLGNLRVDAKENGPFLLGQISPAQRTFDSFDSYA
jgi:hypothetical protein